MTLKDCTQAVFAGYQRCEAGQYDLDRFRECALEEYEQVLPRVNR